MGGGGTYYGRDVTDRTLRTGRGYSSVAEEKMRKSRVDAALLPRNRQLVCESKSPFVYAFDVTGSMGDLPRIIYDKMPMMAGQLMEQAYLENLSISLAAIGDILSDQAPIQICNFSEVRNLDEWLQRIWLEGNGGGQAKESYELMAYFYARNFSMPNAETPIFLFTGDEGFRENLLPSDLNYYFGGEHQEIDSGSVFAELMRKFKDNVFLIHRRYAYSDEETKIVAQWKRVLGSQRVILLENDLAIADVTLGLCALVTGKRTLEEYLQDMKTRGQEKDRIAEVRRSLAVLPQTAKPSARRTKTADNEQQTAEPAEQPKPKNRPGRI